MKTKLLLFLGILALGTSLHAQERDYIRQKIQEWGRCKNVALTQASGDLAIYGKNGWAGIGIPPSLTNALNELNQADQLIHDVQLTEAGKWLILYGENGLKWNGIPYDLERKLREININMEEIISATFNDSGDWIIISSRQIATSADRVYEWIRESFGEYGQLKAAHLSEDGIALCYERGYKYYGNVPFSLRDKLQQTQMSVHRIKFLSSGAYFIADLQGRFAYYF